MNTSKLWILVCLLFFVVDASATKWFVKTVVSGSGSGMSWTDAMGDLQQAIDAASAGDSIWVAQGTYKPTADNPASANNSSRDVTFYINKNIALFGGFMGIETELSQRDLKDHPVILSGDIGILSDASDNAFHVLYITGQIAAISSACVIDGINIMHGNADVPIVPDNVGGGIRIDGAVNNASPTIRNCSLSFNFAQSGGAVFNRGFTGESSPQFINCAFFENGANYGGAVYNGGASGISDPTFTNCTFAQNAAITLGSALLNDGRNGGQCTATMQNCIIWDNGSLANNIDTLHASTLLSYSLLDDGIPDGIILTPGVIDQGNNLDSDPLFSDALNLDFSIMACSQALDAGKDAFNNELIDLCSGFRIRHVIDMGAIENLAGILCPPFGTPLFVDSDQIGCTGTSWASAFDNLQDAIDRACDCSGVQEIWVAEGTYIPTKDNPAEPSIGIRDRSIYLSKPIRIYGGFAGTETLLSQRDITAHPTILSGALLSGDSAYHIMYMDADSIDESWVIDGFTLEHGRATGLGFREEYGGALYAFGSSSSDPVYVSPTISNCTFQKNQASSLGGAIYLRAQNVNDSAIVAPLIQQCNFISNTSEFGGGIGIEVFNSDPAIVAPIIESCRVDSNDALRGAGLYIFVDGENYTTIENSQFSDNTAIRGAIYMQSQGIEQSMLLNTVFKSNRATDGGAGLFVIADSCIITISRSTFEGNVPEIGSGIELQYRGGIIEINNCLFFENSSDVGSGLHLSHRPIIMGEMLFDYRQGILSNCTFVNNSTPGNGGAVSISGDSAFTFNNCIFWNNSAGGDGPDIFHSSSITSDTFRNSIVSPGGLFGNFVVHDTLQRYPLFADTMNFDFRLLPTSPAIDTGANSYVASSTDLDGKARILGTSVDIGAYESGDPCVQKTSFLHPSAFVSGESKTFQTSECILGTNLIKSGAEITYDAFQGIELGALFTVEAGAVFQATTNGCN